MTTTLKRHAKPSRTNAYIDLIEDITDALAEEVTVTKQLDGNNGTRYEVAVKGQTVGWVFGNTGSNYRPYGSTLQVRLRDTMKWSTQTVTESSPRKTSSRGRMEAVYSLVKDFYNA